MSPSTAPSYVEDSNPGSLAPESGILPPSHGASAWRSQFHTNHRVNFSTPTYCLSATFGQLAFCVCPLVFMTKNKKEFRIATVAMFTCDVYAAVFPHMSPPPPTKTAHDLARLRTTGRLYSFINKISFHGSRRFIFTGCCSATHGLLLS